MIKKIQVNSNSVQPKVINLNRIAKKQTLRSVEEDLEAFIQTIQHHKRYINGIVPIFSILIVCLFLFSFSGILPQNFSDKNVFFYGAAKGTAGLVTIASLGINAYLGWLYDKKFLNNLSFALYIVKKAQINRE